MRPVVSDRPGKRGQGWPHPVKEVVATTPFKSDRGSFPHKDLNPFLLAAQIWLDLIQPRIFCMLFFIAELYLYLWAMAKRKKRTYQIKEQIKYAKKLTIEHLFYTIYIATNKRTFFYPRLIFRDTRVVDVMLMRFATNLLKLWVTVVYGLFLYL